MSRKKEKTELAHPSDMVLELRRRGISDREIAEKSGLHISSVCRIRTGATGSPSLSTYARLLSTYQDYIRN